MYLNYLFLFFISFFIMKISLILSLKLKLNMEKLSSFECGFNSIYYKRMPFSIRFFLITIIFLIFDIEIVLLLPMIFSFYFSNQIIWFYSSFFFILVLIIGLFYEWKNGALNWL
uniref:NADH-ubiquinone oxidoreductase chain 3 n=1 Tax=Orseolia oryzae TaxID=33408 RepID=A0A0K0M769_9DIPT|nr:NADH dehydrogenase subunit 3 [Orseolia oryzae]